MTPGSLPAGITVLQPPRDDGPCVTDQMNDTGSSSSLRNNSIDPAGERIFRTPLTDAGPFERSCVVIATLSADFRP